ncbi:AzlC family ABC transporter permease [Bacillus horti]|uniref:4-azaleucine resistance transporter AzlC n=1 Tax=Caldalkalibacillus horti TaxID=77523 RepID=A0ABT9W1E9_9BACI|nr:AzlC family ABC transporter permease [Bacillus horti]MDQ0167067.1 4-azaleucine resistance transporter AzlC [Bacillus horti]
MDNKKAFSNGCRDGLPIALGYIPISITFGVLSVAVGLHPVEATAMSAFVFAGASQFIALSLWTTAGWVEIVLTTFVLNLRHLLMSTSLSRRLNTSRWKASLLSFGITDETFVVTSLKHEGKTIKASYLLGINLVVYLSWVIGTITGGLFGELFPREIINSMGIALYAMFIALLTPAIKESNKKLVIASSSAGLCTILYFLFPGLSQGIAIVLSTIFAATLGVLLWDPQKVGKENNV